MLYDLDAIFHALADPTRRALLRRLAQGPQAVGALAGLFPTISLAAVSKHLHVLERAGLVCARRAGKFQHYALLPEALRHTDQWLTHYRQQNTANAQKTDASATKIALLGLSANPPHAGHLAISRALRTLGYAEVWWSIAPEQEFKPAATLAPYKHRVALAKMLIKGQPGVKLEDTEAGLAIHNEHFRTQEWLTHLAGKYPQFSFTFVMGADSWAHPAKGFHTWGGFAQCLENAGILVIPRPDHATGLDTCLAAVALKNAFSAAAGAVSPGRWALYPTPLANVSSTGIRAQLAAGQVPEGLVPEQLDYIAKHRLYGAAC